MGTSLIKNFYMDEDGQGLTEYGAVFAFVGVVIGLAFSAGQGSFQMAIKNAFSAISSAINQLVSSPPQ